MSNLLKKIHEQIDNAPLEVLEKISNLLDQNQYKHETEQKVVKKRNLNLPHYHLKGALDNFKRDELYD